MFTNNNYYPAMDRFDEGPVIEPLITEDEKAVQEAINLGTAEIGTTTNPMGNTLQSVKSRIMEGAGRLEFEFIGKGKGSSQAPTPESYGTVERRDMKELLTINDIKASVHASVHGESLAGFGREGFSGAQREEALREIKRAIDFAGDVTDGGAIVFHLSEWQRPLIHAGKREEGKWMFKGYDTEEKDSPMIVVDKRTGRIISGVTRDTKVYEPRFLQAKDKPELVGKPDANGVIRKPDDWLDIDDNVIPKDAPVERLFDRVPKFNPDKTQFEVEERNWDYFVKLAEEWNKNHKDDKKTPEEMFAITRLQNQVLQAKGNSLYHARTYNEEEKRLRKLQEAYEFYKKIEEATPENERWRLKQQVPYDRFGFSIPDNVLPTEWLKEQIEFARNTLRHIHEASASADAQAKELEETAKNIDTAEDYGLQKTAETIAKVGLTAMEVTKRKKLSNPLYAAPENFDQHLYGSHPEEMRTIIKKSREVMAEQLLKERKARTKEEAQKLAAQHIKATLDIGHLNMWRQYFDPLDENGKPKYKTAEEREKAFNKWLLDEAEKLVKEGIVGHIHLTDNFGYGDEHLTPGQGNIPMKEFIKRMEKAGIKDMIVEPGSFNPLTAFPDTLSMIGSPIYGVGRLPRFNRVQHQHFGYNAPPFFIAGAYSPSNDWRPWTEVPLE